MVNNTWVTDLQTTVFSRLKAIGTTKLKTKYPKIKFTTLPVDVGTTTFPTVYVHEVDISPLDNSLEQTFNTKDRYVIQVEVFANDSNKTDSKYISTVLMNIMNTMSFKGVPLTEYNTNYTRTVGRYSRNICADDVL